MKTPTLTTQAGFTLAEALIATSVASILLAAIITTSISLQKSFRAVDNYFATHIQQVRIIDYLGRDVKRALTVETLVDKQSVTVTLPKYLIEAGDDDATPANVGTPRRPKINPSRSGRQVYYGTSVSKSASKVEYEVNDLQILRRETPCTTPNCAEGVVTTIASSTDQLVPTTTDVELANTRYTNTTVTFRPIFKSVAANVNTEEDAARLGTTVYSTAYLRNRRR